MRKIGFVVSTTLVMMILILCSRQPATARLAQSTEAATMAATEEDYGAACEALRTVQKPIETPAADATAAATESEPVEIARPSNPGGPGPALALIGNPEAGAKVFVDNCQKCHGEQGQGNVANPGSDDGTIPALNPIDETIADVDARVFACNIDLFVEHGSKPAGDNPQQTMTAWGDESKLTPQQIADVISYVITLNGGTPLPPATAEPTAATP